MPIIDVMIAEATDDAFPTLTDHEMVVVRKAGRAEQFGDGQIVFKAGTAEIDFFVVESGEVEILNPLADSPHVARHPAGHFLGDIDVLTGRPVVVDAVARGQTTLLRVARRDMRRMLSGASQLGEKLLIAFQARRDQLQASDGEYGLTVTGSAHCQDTNLIREFLHKNFVPFTWQQADQHADEACPAPTVRFGDGVTVTHPSLRDLATRSGVWQGCPTETFDLAIIGAGPAGLAASVYAASEGIKTIILDRLGPGGQAGGSSKIENFIGFPSGLSGTDLATRATLQLLKFGAKLAVPVNVKTIEPGKDQDAPHEIVLDCGGRVRADVVLIAVGVEWRKLPARNAERFERNGVYYACTTVESDLHRDQDVAVVGGGNSAGQAAMFLAESECRTVHLLLRSDELAKGMSAYLIGRIQATANIKLHTNVEIEEIVGGESVERAKLHCRDSGERTELAVGGIYVFVGSEPRVTWLPDSIARDERGFVITGPDAFASGKWPLKNHTPCPLETTLPRVLAAGDTRHGSTKRVGFAVGDGSLAVTCVHQIRKRRDGSIPSIPL